MKVSYSILGTALFSLGACAPEEPVCNQYNETTITLNQQVNGEIDNPGALIRDTTRGEFAPSLLDLLNESHARSSVSLPPDAYATFVDGRCEELDDGTRRVAYAIADPALGDRGIYFPKQRIFPRELATLYHEMGHLQECGHKNSSGNSFVNGELTAILNELEQTLCSFGLLYNTHDKEGSIVDRVGFTLPFYREGVLHVQRYIYDSPQYWVGLLSVMDKLVELEGDFSAVREHFTQPECSTFRQQYLAVRTMHPDIVETLEMTAETQEELTELRRFALSQAWPLFQEAYRSMGGVLEKDFDGETAAAWREYAESLDFPKR